MHRRPPLLRVLLTLAVCALLLTEQGLARVGEGPTRSTCDSAETFVCGCCAFGDAADHGARSCCAPETDEEPACPCRVSPGPETRPVLLAPGTRPAHEDELDRGRLASGLADGLATAWPRTPREGAGAIRREPPRGAPPPNAGARGAPERLAQLGTLRL